MADAKYEDKNKDCSGKVMAGVLQDFLPALKEIAELGSMNNKPYGKYDRGSWMLVEDAETLYLDAFWRHQLDGMYNIDPETGKPHLVAIAWNSIALLCFYLRAKNAQSLMEPAASSGQEKSKVTTSDANLLKSSMAVENLEAVLDGRQLFNDPNDPVNGPEQDPAVQAVFKEIDSLSHYEMARYWRFSPAGHKYFDLHLPYFEYFKKRFFDLGGMTPAISKAINKEGENHE